MGDGTASFNFDKMVKGLEDYVNRVQAQLNKLETTTGSSVNLATMFKMQFAMQVMTQYTEAVSNTLSAVHNEMITMARAVKGQ